MKLKNFLWFVPLFLWLITGTSAQPPKEWTVLVYMAADNDLEESALADLREMMGVGSSDTLNLVVQVDRSDDYTAEGVGGLPNWTTSKRLLVQKGKLTALTDLGKTDSGSSKALADFVTWGLTTFPSQKAALILWDHGGGQAGFGSDEGSGDSFLSLPDLSKGITDGIRGAGAKRLDLVGFDACLMATFETARSLAPSARFLLASEELEPEFGWDWNTLGLLNRDPKTSPQGLGSALIAGYSSFCSQNGEGAQFTLSLTDLDKLEPIEAAMKALLGTALPRLDVLGGDFGRARFRSVEFGKSGDPASDTQMVDLGDLARQWQSLPTLKTGAKALSEAVADAVVESKVGSVQKAATGLSIWFPSKRGYYDPEYSRYGPSAWVALLEGYYSAGDSIPPQERVGASAAGGSTPEEGSDDGVSFADGTVEFIQTFGKKVVRNISEALLYYGTLDKKNQAQILGSREAELDLESGEVIGTWDLTTLNLVQGKTNIPVFLSEDETDEKLMSFSVPFSYYPDGNIKSLKSQEELWLSVTIDLETDEIIEETFYQEEGEDLVGEFQPRRGSRIVAQLLERNSQDDWEYVDRGPALDPNKTIDYEFRDLAPEGDFYLSLDITDFGGNDDSVEYEGPLL